MLGADAAPESKEARAAFRLLPPQRQRGTALLRLAALLLFSFPGVPTVFYGDEAGMEGWEDPLNRGTYPWGREDHSIRTFFKTFAALRRTRPSLRWGGLRWLWAEGPLLSFIRETDGEWTAAVLNASPEARSLTLDLGPCTDLLTSQRFSPQDGVLTLELPPYGGLLLVNVSRETSSL